MTKSRPGGQHICTGTKKNGDPCGMINTLRTLEQGYRCRQHRRGLTTAHSGDLDNPMPTTKFKTRADAERFTSWVLEQGARGHINAAQVNALMRAVRDWNKMRQRLEERALEELDDLVTWGGEQKKALAAYADALEGTD